MGRIRALEERDIPRMVDLHRRVFPPPPGTANGLEASQAYVKELLLAPHSSDSSPSLVYEDDRGEPIGFLGVMPRRMVLRGRPIQTAITAHFVVEPKQRGTLAALALINTLLSGSQDLTLADTANEMSRRLWEGLGGATTLLYNFYWFRLFRPAEYVMARWGRGRRLPAQVPVALGRAADAVLTRALAGLFRPPSPATSGEDLDGEMLASCVAEFERTRALRPEYEGRTAAWLMDIVARKPGCEPLRKVLVRTRTGEVAGWYMYCGRRGSIGEVLQVGAREGRIGDVLDHLFVEAWREGMVALVGRIDPRSVDAFSARHCFFHYRGGATLVHARDPELLQTILEGDVFLTRLESEWCLSF